jgi:hypothetical protein
MLYIHTAKYNTNNLAMFAFVVSDELLKHINRKTGHWYSLKTPNRPRRYFFSGVVFLVRGTIIAIFTLIQNDPCGIPVVACVRICKYLSRL